MTHRPVEAFRQATLAMRRDSSWHDACTAASVSLRFLLSLLIVVVTTLQSASTVAAPTATSASPVPSTREPAKKQDDAQTENVAPDSPRAALADFRRLNRAGDYAGAARFLDLSKVDASEGPTLAQHLKEVLNQRLWLDLSKVSPESHGNTADSQPADREELGTIRAASGKPEPVVLVRKSYRPGTHWVFSAETVAQIEGFYDHLDNRWLTDHLPKPLMKMGPRLLRWWQWVALVPLLMLATAVSYLVTRGGRAIVTRTLDTEKATAVHQLHGPAILAVTVGVTYASLPWLSLYQPAQQFLERWCSAFLLTALFWALWRGIELSRHTVSASHWARESLTAHSLLSLGARVAKFAIAAAAFIIVLSQLGYQPTTLLTGLGIGGVALALAAQKTVENLFGAFSLAIDQPFREGDTIKVDGIEGVVTAVGLRSTRIRSADRTVISIPNGKLADMRIETVSRQDKLRFLCTLGLAYASSAQLEKVSNEVKELLASEDLVEEPTIAVRLVALTDAAMNLEASALLDTTDAGKFADARQRLLLGIWRIVEASGAKLASQTRSIQLISAQTNDEPRSPEDKPQRSSSARLSKTG